MLLPQQKNTYAEKTRKIYNSDGVGYRTWAMDCVDYYINQFLYDNNLQEALDLQNAVEGIIDVTQYQHLLNPFGLTENPNSVKVGAKLRNHNILKGIVNLLMGEYGRRTHEFVVTDFNGEDTNKYKEGLAKVLNSYYEQETVNQLNQQGLDTGQPSKEQGTPEEVEEQYKQSFENLRVIRGQDAIDYIRYEQEVEDKFLDMYYDWLTVGLNYSYKCVRNDDVDYEYVPIRELYVPKESGRRYVEDSSFVVRRRFLPINKVLDYYHDYLDDEDLDYLSNTYGINTNLFLGATPLSTGQNGFIKLPTIDSADCGTNGKIVTPAEQFYGIPVYHVQWKSFKKYGILTFINGLGQEDTIEVSDDYVLNKELGDISIEWKWESVVWEGTKIAERVYCLCRELPENRGELNNKGAQKLSYNGIINRSKSGTLQSIIKEGLPYQILINSLHFQLEKIINKNKDKLTVMPYGLVPRKHGIDTTKQMHHADATSILWVDETAPNASFAAQMIKVLDMGLGSYIKDVISIIQYIKQEYWDSIGMNAQRYADVAQGAGKSVTEQAIVRSSIITYELTRRMDKFIEREYQGFLDISKLAWSKGIKKQYILSDGSTAFLELNPDDAIYHLESDYGVFVKDSADLTEALQQFRQLASAYAQQSTALSSTAEIFTNNNMEKIKNIVAKIEDNNKKHEAYLATVSGEQQKEIQQMVNEDKQADRDIKKYEIDMEYHQTVDSASIRTQNNSRNEPRPANEVEIALADHKIRTDNNKELQEERKLHQKDIELGLKQQQVTNQKNKNNNN